MPSDYDSELGDDFVRREQEREQYYGERYETVLGKLKQISEDQERTFTVLNTLEKKFDTFEEKFDTFEEKFDTFEEKFDTLEDKIDTLEDKIDETKAASENAHKEIIERLGRLEQNMK